MRVIGQEYATKTINGGNDIEVWCLEKDTNKPFVVIIKNFICWCYLETGIKGREENESFLRDLKSKYSHLDFDGIYTRNFKLYYYQKSKTNFLQLFFKKEKDMNVFTSSIKTNYIKKNNSLSLPPMIVWESDKKFLNNVDRFYNMTDLKHGDWLEFKNVTSASVGLLRNDINNEEEEYDEDTYVLDFHEFSTDHEAHKSYLKKHIFKYSFHTATDNSSSSSQQILLSRPKVCSFDIECYAGNHNKFVNANFESDAIYMITFVFQRYLEPTSTRKRYLVTLKNTKISQEQIYSDGRFTSKDTEVIFLDEEKEFFTVIGTIFKKENPDIVIGYNTHRFDYSYIATRQKLLTGTTLWNQHLSRHQTRNVNSIERTWKSSAYGTVTEIYPDMCGRISIDLLLFVKNVLAAKLNTYTLNNVANYFLKKEKDDVSAKQMFQWYQTAFTEFEKGDLSYSENMGKVGLYGLQDSELVLDLFEKLNVWPTLIELSGVAGITIEQIFRGQQIRVMSLLANLCYKNGVVIDSRDFHNYTFIKRKEDGEMMSDCCDDDNDDEDCEKDGDSDADYEKERVSEMNQGRLKFKGAFVKEPIPGKYDNVICLDFTSLYPSIIIDRNISYDTFNVAHSPLEEVYYSKIIDDYPHLKKEEGIKKKKNDKRYEFNCEPENTINVDFYDTLKEEGEFDTAKIPFYHFEFIKEKKGLLPILVKGLIDNRKAVKKQMNDYIKELEKEKEAGTLTEEKKKSLELTITILNQRQNALKVTANSSYGFVGAQKIGKLAFGELSAAVTATGRQYIRRVNEYVKEKYGGEIVYGDTDSSMFRIPSITNSKQCNELGPKLAAEISGIFEGGTIKLEFEKAMRMICFKKKKYAAFLLDDNGEYCESKMLFRGIVLARRDNCSLLRDVYKKLLVEILSNEEEGGEENDSSSYKKCYKLIYGTANDLFKEKKSIDELTIINEYKGEYKSVNFKTFVFATESEKLGRPVQAGERISYVIVKEPITKTPVHTAVKLNNLGLKMRDVKYFDRNVDEVDYYYYITHPFQDPIDQLFNIAFKDDDRVLVKTPLKHFEKKSKEKIKEIKRTDKERFEKGIAIDDLRLTNREYRKILKDICENEI